MVALQFNFTYDARGQLTSFDRSDSNTHDVSSYQYDSAGNVTLVDFADTSKTDWEFENYNQANQSESHGQKYKDVSGNNDGNLLEDDSWTYTYDANNRLIAMDGKTGNNLDLDFFYDYMGRRVEKKVYTSGSLTKHVKFLYQGMTLLAELNITQTNPTVWGIDMSFHWGPDKSDVLGGAGGAEGMLYMRDWGADEDFYPSYDLNGNMVELLDSNGDYAAWYAYDPNGRIVQSGGTFAASNPIGFSTQYTDRETGLVYYGLRFYSPDKGRFLNRDPIGEQGGANLYRFVGNNPVSRVDIWGLMTETECLDRGGYWDNGCVLDLGNFDVESDGKTLPSTGFNGSMAFLMSLTSQVGLRGAVVSTGGSGGTGDGNTDADDSDQKENSDCIEKARQKAQRAIANANGEYGLMRHQLEQDQRELHALNAGIARGEWGIKFGVTSAIALPIAWVAELALVAKTAPAVAGAKATLDATVAVGRAGGLGSATNPLIYEASLGYATALRAQSGARLTGSFIAGGAAANLNYSVGLSDSPWGPSDVATEFADSVIGGPAASLAMQLLSFPIEGAFDNSNVPGVNIAGATYLNRYNNAAKAFAADVEKCNE